MNFLWLVPSAACVWSAIMRKTPAKRLTSFINFFVLRAECGNGVQILIRLRSSLGVSLTYEATFESGRRLLIYFPLWPNRLPHFG